MSRTMTKPIALPFVHVHRVNNIMDIEGMREGAYTERAWGEHCNMVKCGNATYIRWNITKKFWSLMVSTNIVHCDKSNKNI